MALYARSDLTCVAVPEDRGGCGAAHTRPVTRGAPARLWKLDCPACCAALAGDPLWSGRVSEIPETPDEEAARVDYETRGAKERDYVQALALAKLANVAIPATLESALTGVRAHIPVEGMLECPQGHEVAPGQKFCGECGTPMRQRAAAASLPPDTAGQVPLEEMHVKKLQKMARDRGLDASGSKAVLIKRLRAA